MLPLVFYRGYPIVRESDGRTLLVVELASDDGEVYELTVIEP